MADAQPALLQPLPGIKRDGTRFSNRHHVDGEWVRFVRGKPTKIGGYRRIPNGDTGAISRGLHEWTGGGRLYLHSGGTDRLEQIEIGIRSGDADPVVTRTPASLVTNANHVWQFDAMQDTVSGNMTLLAHAAANAQDIDSSTTYEVYSGSLTGATVLTTIDDGGTPLKVSGGIVVIHPYAFYLDEGGRLIWSVAGKPTDVVNAGSGEARITDKKLIAGRRVRGANVPTGLIWSLDTLVKATFNGGATVWDFDTIGSIDIMSAASIVEYNGIFYWIGAGRFQSFSGIIRDVQNDFNADWFFDEHLNWEYRGRVYGFAYPRRGEIWWCFPKDTSTECNHALILHVASGAWYDTPLPGGGRSAAIKPSVYRWPLMTGVENFSNKYRLWQHEFGTDEIDGENTRAIRSYFETSDVSLLRTSQPSSKSLDITTVEPDFKQNGSLVLTVKGNANARAPTVESDIRTIPEEATGSTNQVAHLKETYRQARLVVESNEIGGHFEAGDTFIHVKPGDGRITS